MPKVKDYVDGNILSLIEKAFSTFKLLKIPVLGGIVRKKGLLELQKCDPLKVDEGYAARLIKNSSRCAAGQRVCNVLNNGADRGESVFLDELADGLVGAGKARPVDKEEAIRVITENRKGPIMITMVSGKHQEICRSIAKNCVYWNSEKHGLRCIKRPRDTDL